MLLFLEFKKAISPVVATALLLVVAVVSVIGYQVWFTGYFSGVFTDVEYSSSNGVSLDILDVMSEDLYIKNSGGTNISILSVSIGDNSCNVSGNYSGTIIDINVSSCISNLTNNVNDILIVTDKGVFTKTKYFEEIQISEDGQTLSINVNLLLSGSGTVSDVATDITVDSNGNIYVIGTTLSDLDFGNGVSITNAGSTDFFLVKYDSSGVAQFAKNPVNNSGIGEDSGYGVSVDSSGNIYVVGTTRSSLDFGNSVSFTSGWGLDFFLVKYDSSGVAQFVKTSESNSGSDHDEAHVVEVDSVGNIYVVGNTGSNLNFGNGVTISNDASRDFFLVKYNSSGVAQFVKTSESGSAFGVDYAYGLSLDSAGNIYVVGSTTSSLDFGDGINITNDGNYDFFLVKYNSSGVAQFAKSSENSSGGNPDNAKSVEVDSAGNIYVVGYTESSLDFGNGVNISNDGGTDFYLVKYDSSGVAQFAKSSENSSGTSIDYGRDVSVDSNENIYVVGYTHSNLDFGNSVSISNDGPEDFFLVKYDSSGVTQFVKTSENSSGTGVDYARGVDVDSNGDIYVVGYTASDLDFGNGNILSNSGSNDFFMYKYLN